MDATPSYTTFDGPTLDLSVIDSLRELGGDDGAGLVFELIEMFLDDVPERLSEMIAGVDTGNREIMLRTAHSLKAASANMGAVLLSQVCKAMEIAAKAQNARRYRGLADVCREAYEDTARALREIA